RGRAGPLTLRLSPSDLARSGSTGEAELAGRVLAVAGPALTLGDAFATVHVTLAETDPPPALEPGDLVVLAGSLAAARVVERFRPRRPAPAPETETLTLRGV